VAFRPFAILLAELLGFFLVRRGQRSKHVGDAFHFLKANVLSLKISPLVRSFRLEEDFLGRGTMAEKSGDGNQNGQNG